MDLVNSVSALVSQEMATNLSFEFDLLFILYLGQKRFATIMRRTYAVWRIPFCKASFAPNDVKVSVQTTAYSTILLTVDFGLK
jgi:hypothetical protein